MPEHNPRQLALYGLAILALIALAALYLGRGDGAVAAPPLAASPSLRVADGAGGGSLTVHVAGAVRRPGVYRLKAGSRVDDAVSRAGGARPRADLSALNLAARLEDGRQVLVPLRVPAGGGSAVGGAAAGAGGPARSAGGAGGPPSVPINLNTATVEQLDQLDGIGPTTAQHIVEYREAHDGFGSVEELDQVPGIGEKRMATLRAQVRV